MTLERLRQLLEAYGATPARWPEAERAAAQALLVGSPEAKIAYSRAQALDALLDKLPNIPPDPSLARRIAALTELTPQLDRARRGGGGINPLWPRAAGLAAALVVGLWLGASGIGAADNLAMTDLDQMIFSSTLVEAAL